MLTKRMIFNFDHCDSRDRNRATKRTIATAAHKLTDTAIPATTRMHFVRRALIPFYEPESHRRQHTL